MKLNDKIAIVTGAGRGIGKGCAMELARNGADLILNDLPGSTDVKATHDEVLETGAQCDVASADAFTRAGCQHIVDTALRRFGRIDILVSNPAATLRSPFLDTDPREFERVVAGTLLGGFHLSQLVARHFVERGNGGKIIFVSSVQAEMPFAGSVAYGASKAALNHMAQTISVELAEHRVNVNVIEPGWIDTPGERSAFGGDTIDREAQNLPWGRLGTPGDVAKTAAFLASADADYITGTVVCVDGGFRHKDLRAQQLIQRRDT